MPESNAKLLKDIKNVWKECQTNGYKLDNEDVDWLIERVQELEKELKECYKQNNNFSNEHWGLQAENKRFREALEFYENKNNYNNHIDYCESCIPFEVYTDSGIIARKALEGTV